jgi:hypothetical protein
MALISGREFLPGDDKDKDDQNSYDGSSNGTLLIHPVERNMLEKSIVLAKYTMLSSGTHYSPSNHLFQSTGSAINSKVCSLKLNIV